MIVKKANLTVIISCYNVELYITNCLDSLVNQTFLPEEIICVNDGSTDQTEEILLKYAAVYE